LILCILLLLFILLLLLLLSHVTSHDTSRYGAASVPQSHETRYQSMR
jgi:hypothetical protein